MKHNCTTYITVRIDCESERELSDEDVDELISEMDYKFKSQTAGTDITGTEICGRAI